MGRIELGPPVALWFKVNFRFLLIGFEEAPFCIE